MQLRWKLPLLLGMIVVSTTAGCGSQPAQLSPAALAAQPTAYVAPTPLGAVPLDRATRLPVPTLVIPTPIMNKPSPSGDWQHHWLQGNPCAAPCWEGITPGQTRVRDALNLLNQNVLVRSLQNSYDVVAWNGLPDGASGNLLYPVETGSPVVIGTNVWLRTTFRLNEIVAAYGEPSHLLPLETIASDPHSGQTAHVYELVVVYMSKGFYLTLSVDRIGKPLIAPELALFGHVRFFAPTATGFDTFATVYHERWTSADLVPWQGFQEFDAYCAQMRSVPYNICGGGYQLSPT